MSSSLGIFSLIAAVFSVPASYAALKSGFSSAERKTLKSTLAALEEMGITPEKVIEIQKQLVIEEVDLVLSGKAADIEVNKAETTEKAPVMAQTPSVTPAEPEQTQAEKDLEKAKLMAEGLATGAKEAQTEEELTILKKEEEEKKKQAYRMHLEQQVLNALKKLNNNNPQKLTSERRFTKTDAIKALEHLSRTGQIDLKRLGELSKPFTGPTPPPQPGGRGI
ncbi:MAG: hypothetical protein IPP74_01205 [Alphaproteobacteria bacterium]|nr:hypothetical protein [Alphaproteobacteria bacterium]